MGNPDRYTLKGDLSHSEASSSNRWTSGRKLPVWAGRRQRAGTRRRTQPVVSG